MMPPRKARTDAGADAASTSPSSEVTHDAKADADARAREREIADERLADRLVQLVGDRVWEQLDPEHPSNIPYFNWLAEEARAAQTPEERAQTARDAQAFAREMMRVFHEVDDDTTTDDVGAMPCAHEEAVAHAPRSRGRGMDAVREAAREGYVASFPLSVAAGVGHELWDEPADAWLEVPEGVPPGQHVAFSVRGDSMHPLLHDGDRLLVRLGSDVAAGDVIVARRPDDGYVVKRVAGVTADALRLASDNAAYADFTLPRDPALVVGTVVLRWCAHARGAG